MRSSEPRSITYSQNFLRDPRLIQYLLNAANISPEDTVYEIGAGKGAVTALLALRCRRLVAIEKDPALAGPLKRRFANTPGVSIHEADFLRFPLPNEPYKVFANIPFNVTTAILTKLTTATLPPEDSYLMVQKEAAQRFLGEPAETLYAVMMKPWFEPSLLYNFCSSDFSPAPRVDVVMLRLRKRGPPIIPIEEAQTYRDFVVYGFTTPRPTLRGTLRNLFGRRQLDEVVRTLDLKPEATPSTVPFEHWLGLYYSFQLYASTAARQEVQGAERRLRQRQEELSKVHRTRVSSRDKTA